MDRDKQKRALATGELKSKRNKHRSTPDKQRSDRLKQAKLTTLESPIKSVAQSVNDRRKPSGDKGAKRPEASLFSDDEDTSIDELVQVSGPAPKKTAQELGLIFSSEEEEEIRTKSKSNARKRKRDEDKHVSVKHTSEPRHANRSKTYQKQSKINFRPGTSRVSTPDSEEEAFRTIKLGESDRSRAQHSTIIDLDEAPDEPRQRNKPLTTLVDDEDSEDELITPARRRRRYLPPPDEEEDHKPFEGEDMDAYEDEEAPGYDIDQRQLAIKPANSGRNAGKKQYRSALEKLKRRKAGLPSSSEASDADDTNVLDDDVDERQSLGSFEVSGDEEIEVYNPRTGLEELDGEVPAEYMQPRTPLELFKICCQWEVIDLILPQGGLEPDRYFKTAINWLRDRTAAKADIALSSIWKRTFMRALQNGPDLAAVETGNLGYYCDACGRSNRIATYVVRFEGSRYDHVTLEDLDADADSSEDDLYVDAARLDDPIEERKRQERALRQEFNLGVNCFERTEVVHELFHLRKHLRMDIADKLSEWGHFSAVNKYARSIMTHEQRIEQANEITEALDNKKVMARWWSKYKDIIERGEQFIVDPNVGKRRGKYVVG
ncbi:hypothetical protein BCR37DRAFT_396981 [Protomyces lactucae-debilis]|uniref:DUF4211 domain-containing protein n=1 Tax=Protomyces lactucae-debilis TaxID=2754530 RepID=A0A1Y2FT26_PROLT|nr:uncharacterized protein BCR37DRAFT_396981 [Protomyces lactucae-debilis]ORY86336.1 hypothetical protein BCR37DRAFT_396981 [Protomyces lactucae-debilis]